ncbi:hypothetical protein P879_09822 [Paragonimus westermani]|uniref:Uncharacterized protein n=1 Tax=Paragonimus westermani TaxID=34504 RepID=A0A8T0DJP6_9TREM|nr:hypothetical protein P879_09822 [Paragonimus westermani]
MLDETVRTLRNTSERNYQGNLSVPPQLHPIGRVYKHKDNDRGLQYRNPSGDVSKTDVNTPSQTKPDRTKTGLMGSIRTRSAYASQSRTFVDTTVMSLIVAVSSSECRKISQDSLTFAEFVVACWHAQTLYRYLYEQQEILHLSQDGPVNSMQSSRFASPHLTQGGELTWDRRDCRHSASSEN